MHAPRMADAFFFFVFLFSVCLSMQSSAGAPQQLNQRQFEALKWISGNISANAVWNTSDPNPCLWGRRVNCSTGNHSVVKLDLSGLGISASSGFQADFFGLLCRFESLKHLDLSANALASIPDYFFSNCSGLRGLKLLNLSSNALVGTLWNFSGYPNLETLDLSSNSLNGAIDSMLHELRRLKSLNLSRNFFNTNVPPLANHTGWEELALSSNQFSGPIPDELRRHRNLRLLDLSWNNLNGSIPHFFGELPKLETLLLSSNRFVGQIPSNLFMIKTLSRFAANMNNFSGAIPDVLAGNITVLDLSYNRLTGKIPWKLLSSPTLESVDLTGNKLEGSIPPNVSQKLYRLRLGGNSLIGSIPQTIGKLSSLSYLELNDNKLNSSIPSQIGDCRNLTLLNLASNSLDGELPSQLGALQSLVVLKIQVNHFRGEIPDQLFQLKSLGVLNLSHNSLTGVIPSEISRLQKLSNMNLGNNGFNGSLPDTIGGISSLIELQLGNNKLSGTVPRMPANLGIALNLSNNHFNGSLPYYLGDLTELEVLDLSNNEFTGEVPSSFSYMKSLIKIDLSNNQLSGELPAFGHFVSVIYSGNKGLRNTNETDNTVYPRKRKSAVLPIILGTIGAFTGFILAAAVLVAMFSHRSYRIEAEGTNSRENIPQIVNGCFITANSIHQSSIDFSKSMEAVGNPRNIMQKTRFSTYYKAVMPNEISYSVKKINLSDKIFQMGSSERFGQELEALGKLSSTNLMVPLAYVLTEDSAYLVYEHAHMGTLFDLLHRSPENGLDWPSRYSILLGVAQGLTFLHGCTEPILLLDLSAKSIHLKSRKDSQIGDIELCRVLDPLKRTGSLSTIAGSVGYIPPEYAYTMKLTMAGNVYSFGVILLELLTGKPPVSGGIELAKWALSCSTRPREQILDSRISKTSLAVRSQMLSVLKVALACVNAAPAARPKMRNTLRMLFNAK